MALILSQAGIETATTVEAWHVTQSIDAFTGAEAYDITLSGSFTLQNGSEGADKIAVSDANGLITFTGSFSELAQSSTDFYNFTSSYNNFTSSYNTGSFSGSFTGTLVGSVTSASYAPNFANTNLTFTGNRTHALNGNDLTIGQGSSQTFSMFNGYATQMTYSQSIWEMGSNYQTFSVKNTQSLDLLATEVVINDGSKDLNFRVESDLNANMFFVDAGTDRVGIGTNAPNSTLDVNGNTIITGSLVTTSTIGTDKALDLTLQVSGTNALTIEGSTSTYKKQVNIALTSSKSGATLYPGLSIGSVTDGIGVYDPGDTSGKSTSIIKSGVEAASFQQVTGINGFPVCIIGERDYFPVNEKWGNTGLHVQSGGVTADSFASNVFYSGLTSDWCKKNYECGMWITPTTSSLLFHSAPSSSITGSASSGVAIPTIFMEIDPNYVSASLNEPNVTITNRLSIGQLWAGTNTAIGRASTGEITAASSDQRLKTNIQTITGSLDIINGLNGVWFDWTNLNEPDFKIGNEATGSQMGLIAQQVQQVLPQVVKPNGFGDYLTVEYDKLVAVLIEGIKEQQQEINTLKSEIQAIKTHLGI